MGITFEVELKEEGGVQDSQCLKLVHC